MCRSPLPSGLCLAFGKNTPLQTSPFLKGKIYFMNWPTPESNRFLVCAWGGREGRAGGSRPWGLGGEPGQSRIFSPLSLPLRCEPRCRLGSAGTDRRTRCGVSGCTARGAACTREPLSLSISSRSSAGGAEVPLSDRETEARGTSMGCLLC